MKMRKSVVNFREFTTDHEILRSKSQLLLRAPGNSWEFTAGHKFFRSESQLLPGTPGNSQPVANFRTQNLSYSREFTTAHEFSLPKSWRLSHFHAKKTPGKVSEIAPSCQCVKTSKTTTNFNSRDLSAETKFSSHTHRHTITSMREAEKIQKLLEARCVFSSFINIITFFF